MIIGREASRPRCVNAHTHTPTHTYTQSHAQAVRPPVFARAAFAPVHPWKVHAPVRPQAVRQGASHGTKHTNKPGGY